MERRKKVPFQNQMVEGVEVSFQTGGEHWNEYLLEDGLVIRIKIVITEIVRLENQYDPVGDPIYSVRSTNVMAVSANEKLRRPPTGS